jgi:hypothetical protein
VARYSYHPKQAGLICITDVWHTRLAYMDCSSGGAQQAFDDLCDAFERAGWELEKRVFDRRYIRREWVRWEIEIRTAEQRDTGDGRGFMAAIVDHYKANPGSSGDAPKV